MSEPDWKKFDQVYTKLMRSHQETPTTRQIAQICFAAGWRDAEKAFSKRIANEDRP